MFPENVLHRMNGSEQQNDVFIEAVFLGFSTVLWNFSRFGLPNILVDINPVLKVQTLKNFKILKCIFVKSGFLGKESVMFWPQLNGEMFKRL